MDPTTPFSPPTTKTKITTVHPSLKALDSLSKWLKTCMESVFLSSESDCLHEIADTDVQCEIDVMTALLQDIVSDDLSRAQLKAMDSYEQAISELAGYLQNQHEIYVENQKRWFASVFSRPQEQHGVFSALLRRMHMRGTLLLRILSVSQIVLPSRDPLAPTMDTPTANRSVGQSGASAEDMPIESTFIKLQKKYIQEMALKESLEEKRQKRRRTLASFPSPAKSTL